MTSLYIRHVQISQSARGIAPHAVQQGTWLVPLPPPPPPHTSTPRVLSCPPPLPPPPPHAQPVECPAVAEVEVCESYQAQVHQLQVVAGRQVQAGQWVGPRQVDHQLLQTTAATRTKLTQHTLTHNMAQHSTWVDTAVVKGVGV